MTDEFFGERRRALEESFFTRRDQQLLEQMRHSMRLEETARSLGMDDVQLLQKLEGLGVDPASFAALSLVPLVEVAWADGTLDQRERQAVLEAAGQAGITAGTPAHQALSGWLESRPGSALRHAWTQYIQSLTSGMDSDERQRLKHQILERAQGVAEAAGGLLGLGNRISAAEREKLTELEAAFGG
jgi:hypothetical protein